MFCPLHYRSKFPKTDKLMVTTMKLDDEWQVVGVCGKCYFMHVWDEAILKEAPDFLIYHDCDGNSCTSQLDETMLNLEAAFAYKKVQELNALPAQ